jgi:nucleotide-binding universal stress UspA family protein
VTSCSTTAREASAGRRGRHRAHARLPADAADVAAPIPVFSGFVPPVSEEELVRAAERTAEEGEALVPDGIPVSSLAAEGHPGIELVKRAEGADHDLFVMGSRGRGAVRSAVLGCSVSHYVLNHAHVPVLVVHDEGDTEVETEV